ncbi:hypothetical protein ACVWZR_002233 [Bradyrhizobium sp. i1.3.1]
MPAKNSIKDANSDKPAERAKAAGQKETHLLQTLKEEIRRPDSKIREFLMGDVYKFVTELVDRAKKEGGQVYLALYELHDNQLIKLLVDAMKSKLIHVILTTAGNLNPNCAAPYSCLSRPTTGSKKDIGMDVIDDGKHSTNRTNEGAILSFPSTEGGERR